MARLAERVWLRHTKVGEDLRTLPFGLGQQAVDLDFGARTGRREERDGDQRTTQQSMRSLHVTTKPNPRCCSVLSRMHVAPATPVAFVSRKSRL
jgi:hypothetical protein